MKEIWDLAISGQVLPFTLLLIPVILYWILAVLGALDLDFLDVDLDTEIDVDAELDADGIGAADAGHGNGIFMSCFQGGLRAINATDVPLMLVLSILAVMMWICAGIGNMILNPGGGNLMGTIVGVSSIVIGMGMTRLLTEPLRPMFRAMKGKGTENRPVVGRSGIVRSHELDESAGQVEIEEKGEVLLLNARLSQGSAPLKRGDEVVVYEYDQERSLAYVKELSTK